jgi:membrane AbrB-like protein
MRTSIFSNSLPSRRRLRAQWRGIQPRTVRGWLICLAAGWIGSQIGIPVAWLVCPMIAALALRLMNAAPGPHPGGVFIGVQAIIGTVQGAVFSLDSLRPLAGNWLPVSGAILAVLVVSVIAGKMMARFTAIPLSTAQIGTIPGGAAGMVALSEDLGADTRLVAFMQYARVMFVIVAISLYAHFAGHGGENALVAQTGGADELAKPLQYLLTTIVTIVGAWVGLRLRLPAGAMLGPLVLALLCGVFGIGPLTMPAFVLPVAYFLLGTRIGSRFDRETLRLIRTVAFHLAGFMIGLIGMCGLLGVGLAYVTDIDLLTALLATSPGGSDVAMIAALETGANAPVVASIQITRLLVMLLIGPVLVKRLLGDLPRISSVEPEVPGRIAAD